MYPEVFCNGEWVEKSQLNAYLSNPENPRQVIEEQERQKREPERERQQQYRDKKKRAESDSEKIKAYMQKFHQEFPGQWSEDFARQQVQRAHNALESDRQHQKYLKDQEEWLRERRKSPSETRSNRRRIESNAKSN